MHCAFCRSEMRYVHGHAACVKGDCPMFGLNQDECCSGDMGCVPTSLAAARAAHTTGAPPNKMNDESS